MWKWKFGKETNKQPAPLVIPQGSPFVLSENGKRVFFGKYPQNVYPLNPSFLSLEPNQDGYYTIIGEDTTLVRQKACSAFVAAGGKRIAEGTALFFKREPVEWDVLRFENGEALLISHNILDCKPFSESVAMRPAERKDAHGYEIKFACSDISSVPANSWELSGLREWLNWPRSDQRLLVRCPI